MRYGGMRETDLGVVLNEIRKDVDSGYQLQVVVASIEVNIGEDSL